MECHVEIFRGILRKMTKEAQYKKHGDDISVAPIFLRKREGVVVGLHNYALCCVMSWKQISGNYAGNISRQAAVRASRRMKY